MLAFLSLLFAVNSGLHFYIVAKWGMHRNTATLIFAFIYGAIAYALFVNWGYALWAALVFGGIGLLGITLTMNSNGREGQMNRILQILDLVMVVLTVLLLVSASV